MFGGTDSLRCCFSPPCAAGGATRTWSASVPPSVPVRRLESGCWLSKSLKTLGGLGPNMFMGVGMSVAQGRSQGILARGISDLAFES